MGFSVLIESAPASTLATATLSTPKPGATTCSSRAEVFEKSDAVLQIRGVGGSANGEGDLDLVRTDQILIGQHDPLWRPELTQQLAEKGSSACCPSK